MIKPEVSKLVNNSKKALDFDQLVGHLKRIFVSLPDKRKGKNKTYEIADAALSAFSVFFTQCPSFLSYQKLMQEAKGQNNARSLFQVNSIPSDNQIRNLLDPIDPWCLSEIFKLCFEQLEQAGELNAYRYLNEGYLIAVDGVYYHSSEAIRCNQCAVRNHKNGTLSYSHSAITPVIVAPGKSLVISMMPEFISPQDGQEKQDCEAVAIKRWLVRNAEQLSALNPTLLGDDLYSRQPICEAMRAAGCHFLLTCKPQSHRTLSQWVSELESLGKVEVLEVSRREGKKTYTDRYRFINQIPIRDGEDALQVNWCELLSLDDTGKQEYKNAFITEHEITSATVERIVKAARARWKVENENNNVLKNNGYHLTHNFGHGKHFLSQFLLTLNLIAFLFHTVLHQIDSTYQSIRHKLPTRQAFFNDIKALTRYVYFPSWRAMMEFMWLALEIGLHDTS